MRTGIKIGERKIRIRKSGQGYYSYDIGLPKKWVEKNDMIQGDKLECIINPKRPDEIIFKKAGDW